MLFVELPCERHIRFFQWPHFDTRSDQQFHCRIKSLESTDMQIGMCQLLQDFC